MIVLIIALIIISAISKSIMDVLQFHYDESIFKKIKNQYWWDPKISYLNKYKDRKYKNGGKFIGSTIFLVFLTDAWHFFQEIFLNCLILSIIIALNNDFNLGWWMYIIEFVALKLIMGSVFELFYSKFFKKKGN